MTAEAYLASLRRPGETILSCEDRRLAERADHLAGVALPALRVICSWCRREMPPVPCLPAHAGQVSHTICPECRAKYFPATVRQPEPPCSTP